MISSEEISLSEENHSTQSIHTSVPVPQSNVVMDREEFQELNLDPLEIDSHEQLENQLGEQNVNSQNFNTNFENQDNYENNTEKNHVHKESKEDENSLFECNICLESAKDPVITRCGHLYCWNCLYKWLHSPSNPSLTCPVCKSGVKMDELTPIYGRGGSTSKSHQNTSDVPNRPSGTRSEPDPNPSYTQNFQNGILGGFMMGSDISLFQLPFFGMSFQLGPQNRGEARTNAREDPQIAEQREFIKRLLIFIAIIVIFCVIRL